MCRLSWSATTSAKPASVVYAARRPCQPAPKRSTRNAAVQGPRQHREHDQRVELRVVAQAREADGHPQREHRQRVGDRAAEERLEGDERRRAEAQNRRAAPLQLALLPEIERGERGGERQAREPGQHEADVRDQEQRRVAALARAVHASRGVRDRQQQRRERHHDEPEQPEPRPAAPDQVRADDEPDEEVERPGPRVPRKAVRARRLRDEERRLHEPADAHAPGREPAHRAGPPRVARVRDRSLAVREQRRPEEQLSHRASPVRPASGPRAPASSRETLSAMISR